MKLHGPRFIITEFALAAAIGLTVSFFTVWHLHSTIGKILLSLYFIGYTLNCLMVCFIAWSDRTRVSKGDPISYERLGYKSAQITLFLLLPAFVFTVALYQLQKRK